MNNKPIPVPRVRLRPLDELQQFVHKDRVPKLKQEKPIKLTRVYRLYKEKHRLLVVKLRYGSTSDYAQLRHGWAEIERITGIKADTARIIVAWYHANGNSAKPRPRRGRLPQRLPDDVTEYLRTSLHADRFLSLKHRCRLIKQKFNYTMHCVHLRRVYKRMGITYKRTSRMMKSGLTGLGWREPARHEFAQKLVSLMM